LSRENPVRVLLNDRQAFDLSESLERFKNIQKALPDLPDWLEVGYGPIRSQSILDQVSAEKLNFVTMTAAVALTKSRSSELTRMQQAVKNALKRGLEEIIYIADDIETFVLLADRIEFPTLILRNAPSPTELVEELYDVPLSLKGTVIASSFRGFTFEDVFEYLREPIGDLQVGVQVDMEAFEQNQMSQLLEFAFSP